MRILIIGATGTIGRPLVAALQGRHELVLASRQQAHEKVDLSDPDSIRALYKRIGRLDAVVSAAGEAKFSPLAMLSDDDFAFSLKSKLMGQVNLVRYGFDSVSDGGSFTLTSGVLASQPSIGSGAVSLVNSGVEGFGRSAALEAPRGIRVNIISPPWITETLIAFKMDPTGGMPAADVARAYVEAIEGKHSGSVISPKFVS
ncbi:MAG: short chain dehydrogenase, partial [Gemmatimonadota bacterium]|nr:short chain dehydrogenase [Gemmatimonadaceae bacterium]